MKLVVSATLNLSPWRVRTKGSPPATEPCSCSWMWNSLLSTSRLTYACSHGSNSACQTYIRHKGSSAMRGVSTDRHLQLQFAVLLAESRLHILLRQGLSGDLFPELAPKFHGVETRRAWYAGRNEHKASQSGRDAPQSSARAAFQSSSLDSLTHDCSHAFSEQFTGFTNWSRSSPRSKQ